MGYMELEIVDSTKKEDYIISTIKPGCSNVYETAICLDGLNVWHILENYTSKENAIIGHKKYSNMSIYELEELTRKP